jgi:hypothetical protein
MIGGDYIPGECADWGIQSLSDCITVPTPPPD